LRDLENVVFRLKEYSLRADYDHRKNANGVDFESYPELVAEKKSPPSADVKVPSSASSSSQQQQQQQADKNGSTGSAVQPTSQTQATGRQPTTDDISLREALEFLVNLAKQKKQEKRDHDIPFPLVPSK
jgi:hypothetical protein